MGETPYVVLYHVKMIFELPLRNRDVNLCVFERVFLIFQGHFLL